MQLLIHFVPQKLFLFCVPFRSPIAAIAVTTVARITKRFFIGVSWQIKTSLFRGVEYRIALAVDRACFLGWYMASLAILLVADRHLLIWRVGFVERPAPAISPEFAVRVATFVVLNHHEP